MVPACVRDSKQKADRRKEEGGHGEMGAREKSPGLKILWVWTIGTAAVLVTNVVRTRMQDMDKLLKAEADQPQTPPPTTNPDGDADPVLLPDLSTPPDHVSGNNPAS